MLKELLNNRVLMIVVVAWTLAQTIKFALYYFINGELDLSRLVGDGGMPSSHSAVVTSAATICGMTYGLDSFEFGISAVVAIIVMHDAMGVRLESGKQAKAINEIRDIFKEIMHVQITEGHLKEFLGHTPMQVVMGALLGFVVGLAGYFIVV